MASFWDSISNFIPETERTKLYKAENALRLRALEREEAAAVREEENLLRRQGMANFAVSPSLEAAYPEFIAQDQQRNALDRADPAAALGRLEAKLYPAAPEEYTLTPGAKRMRGQETIAENVVPVEAFEGTNMQIPGTDRVVFAGTKEAFENNLRAGYVPIGKSVPGAPSQENKPPPNDYMSDPSNPARRVMVPGGPAAVSRAEALAKPVMDERKAYNEAATQYGTMTDLMNDDSGASDISLVYTFFKAADPQSTVREGEFATVGEKMGLPSKIVGQLNSLSSGRGFLTPDVRKSLVDTAGRAVLQRKRGLQRSYRDASSGLDGLGVDRKAFLPFSVSDINLAEVREEFPDAQQDTAGRVFVIKNGKRRYIELDE